MIRTWRDSVDVTLVALIVLVVAVWLQALAIGANTTTLAQASWLLDALAAICIPPQTGRFQMFRYDG